MAIVGTLTTALIALVIGVPLSLGIAIFLTQLCPPWLKRPVATTIELLAAAQVELVKRAGIEPLEIEQVVGGCVTQAGEQGSNITRNA